MENGEQSAAPEAAAPSGNMTVDQLASMLRPSAPGSGEAAPASNATNTPETQSEGSTPAGSNEQPAAGGEPNPETNSPTPEEEATESAPLTETPGTDENAPEQDDEIAGAEEDAKNPNAVRKLQKRVATVVKQRNDEKLLREHAETQVRELQQKLQEAQGKNGTDAPQTERQGAGVNPEIQKIDQDIADIEAVLRWAEENPDGAEVQNQGKTLQYTAADIRNFVVRQGHISNIDISACTTP